jgi:hypothetical protein
MGDAIVRGSYSYRAQAACEEAVTRSNSKVIHAKLLRLGGGPPLSAFIYLPTYLASRSLRFLLVALVVNKSLPISQLKYRFFLIKSHSLLSLSNIVSFPLPLPGHPFVFFLLFLSLLLTPDRRDPPPPPPIFYLPAT